MDILDLSIYPGGRKKNYIVLPSSGAVEDTSRALEVAALNEREAKIEYRRIMGRTVHWLEPVLIKEVF